MLNAMSVDIEDWFQVGAFEKVIRREDWDSLERRVEDNTLAVIDLFAEAGVKATFFTLGWVADRHGPLMRRIVEAGHELASHGYGHERVFTLSPQEFRANIERTRKLLEDCGGAPVRGYRAPSFSIDTRTPWAHEIIAETGHSYSSSVAPLAHDHYGWPDSPRFFWQPLPDHELTEFPITTMAVAGRRIALGGGFFRLLPYGLSSRAVAQANGKDRHPAVFYFHPWDIDPDQPRMTQAPLKSRLRHYSRLSAMAGKLRRLMADHQWDRVDHVVARYQMEAA